MQDDNENQQSDNQQNEQTEQTAEERIAALEAALEEAKDVYKRQSVPPLRLAASK